MIVRLSVYVIQKIIQQLLKKRNKIINNIFIYIFLNRKNEIKKLSA